jgi:hypothetical protein
MTFKYGNWLGENTSTVGQGPINLGGAVPGFSTFIYLGDCEVYYTIVDGNKKECGIGTITGRVMERTTVIATLVDGIYTENSAPLSLTGSAQVFGTINSEFFKSILLKTENAASATKLKTPVAITIAGVSKQFDGSAPVSWSPAEIGLTSISSFKNKIHNGKMEVSQRGSSMPIPIASTEGKIDRFACGNSTAARGTINQAVLDINYPNKGIRKCLSVALTTPVEANIASKHMRIGYLMEGYDVRELTAKPFIISFTAKTSKAGTYSFAMRNGNRSKTIVVGFTLPANIWKSVEIAMPALPIGFVSEWENGLGMELCWTLAAGADLRTATLGTMLDGVFLAGTNQVSWGTSVSDTFQLTEVQLETGTTKTDFEHRPYQVELSLCQRYLLGIGWQDGVSGTLAAGGMCTSSVGIVSIGVPVQMRATPTIEGGTWLLISGSGVDGTGALTVTLRGTNIMINQNITGAAGQASYLASSQTTDFRGFNAELT